MVGMDGLEPSTLRLSGVRSNHLSYMPSFDVLPRFALLEHEVGAHRERCGEPQSSRRPDTRPRIETQPVRRPVDPTTKTVLMKKEKRRRRHPAKCRL